MANAAATTRTPPRRPIDALRRSLDLLAARVPASWSIEVAEDAAIGDRRADAIVELVAPNGERARIVVEARSQVDGRMLDGAMAQVRSLADRLPDGPPVASMVVARYLSPPVLERLAAAGIAYADATGNLLLAIDRPALFLRDVGADADPWRGRGRPRGSLKSATAARLVRALADFAPPYGVPELAARSGASIGATYRMVDHLEREGLISRERRGPITRIAWRDLIERRAEALGDATQEMTLFLEPRGIEGLLTGLQTAGNLRYVLTGTLAARYYDGIVPPRLAVIYADPPEAFVEQLDLRPSPAGNVLVGAPIDDVVFERRRRGSPRVAAPSQVALDLLGGPGRGPAEGRALLDWMERNPDAWRQ